MHTVKPFKGSGVLAQLILDLGTRWQWVVASRPCQLNPRERVPNTSYIWGWVNPRSCLYVLKKRKIFMPAEIQTLDVPACSLVTLCSTLSSLPNRTVQFLLITPFVDRLCLRTLNATLGLEMTFSRAVLFWLFNSVIWWQVSTAWLLGYSL